MIKGNKKMTKIPGHPKVPCFLEVFCYIKPTKKHSFGCLGILQLCSFLELFSFGLPVSARILGRSDGVDRPISENNKGLYREYHRDYIYR